MSGKKELDLTAPNVVSVGGKTWELEPIAGLKGMFVVPKIFKLVAVVVHAAGKANFDLRGLFGGSEEDFDFFSSLKLDNLLAIPYIADVLEENQVVIANEILPLFLSTTSVWLMNHGTTAEIVAAIAKAFKFHAPSIFGDKPYAALKKLLTEEQEEEPESQDAEQETNSE